MEQITSTIGPTKVTSKSEVTVDKLYAAQFQKPDTLSVQLRQTVSSITSYPSRKPNGSLTAGIFDEAEFGFEPKTFPSDEIRIAWVNVPAGSKEDEVKVKIAEQTKKGSCIYKVLSTAPILDENQQWSVATGRKTLADYANKQAVRYGNTPDNVLKNRVGKLTLFNGLYPQYRQTFYWRTPLADQDVRTTDVTKHYVSPEIEAEMKGAAVLQGQQI